MKNRSRIYLIILVAILAFCLLASPLSANLLEIDNTPPAGFSETTNPYGYKEGDPFPLVIKNEVAFYGCSVSNAELGLKDTNSRDDLNDLIRDPSDKTGDDDYANPGGIYLYVQAIAFDGDGDGKKNHVAFVGINNSTYYAQAWVVDMNSSDRKSSEVVNIGPMTWMSDGKYKQFSSTSLFSITAGDYDGDGKDSVVIAAPLDYATTAYGSRLTEFTMDTNANELRYCTWSTKHLGDQGYINPGGGDAFNSYDVSRNKMGISLSTGDYNGDHIDDLAVLTYRHKMYNSSVDKKYYNTNLTIVYRTNRNNYVIESGYYKHFNLTTEANGSITFPMACTLTTGNWNNDDFDDLAVVGIKGSASLNGSKINGQISVSDSKWYVQNIYGGKDEFTVQGANYVGANEWYKDGFYVDDNCYGRVMAEGFALNGENNPDYLFISGSLYEMSTGAPVYVGQNGYFSSGDEGLNSHLATNTFMQSTTVGNFIGDPAGREQVLYTVGMKHKGKDKYYYKCGYVSGKDYQDTDETYGLAGGYYFSDVDDDSSYIYEDKYDNLNDGLNCSLIAVDYGNDSVYAKYLGKMYAYTDPTVSMVLQAAPYFSEISGPGSNWTEYKLTTIFGNGFGGSKTYSGGVGISGSGGIPGIFNIEASLEYAGSLTEAWEKNLTTTTSQSFVATAYDTVVVNRIPVFIYQYDVMDENGKWYGGPKMELRTPRPPTYESLSVDDYNAFAEEFNSKMEFSEDDYSYLETIDKAENFLDQNEGNPYAYNLYGWGDGSINATQISSAPVSLGTNGSLGRVEWTYENTRTDSWEVNHGFEFAFCTRFGPEKFGAGVSGGFNFASGEGESTTTGTAVGATCTVQDIDGPSLVGQGIPQEVVSSYGFDWTLGRWERHLCGYSYETTPFIGYSLSNITSPPLSVKDLSTEAVDNESIKLTWTKPNAKGTWPNIIGYDVYAVDSISGAYTKVGERLAADATSYTVTGLSPLTEYTFVIVSVTNVDNKELNSIWSNEAQAKTTAITHTLTYGVDDEKAADITVTTVNGKTVNSGDKVAEGSILKITATAKDENSTILSITVKNGTTVNTIEAKNGTTETAYAVMKKDTEITVNTYRVLTEAEVTYKDTYEGGTVAATVYGISLAAPGGIVSAPITFTATPKDGYVLEAWNITCDGVTYTKDAANMNPFTLPLEYDTNYVEAVFTQTTEAKVTLTVEQPQEGGTIEIADADGNVIALNEANSATLSYGQEITVTAKPATGYVFTRWTKDAANQTAESFTIKAEKDMTFGVNFLAPVKYAFTYSVNGDDGCGSIATDPVSASGKTYAAGTEVKVKIQAADGYYISGASLSQGTTAQNYIFNAANNKTAIEATITMNANTTLDVKFDLCPCNTYTDVSRVSWYHRSVINAVDSGWMKGYSENTFAPMDTATRAQIVTILYRLSGSPETIATSKFKDVDADAWYAKAVAWAEENGIAKGITTEYFAPNAEVTREQMATFLHRYALKNNIDAANDADLSKFSDHETISEYAKESMKWAIHHHLIIGKGNGELAPGEYTNRAQIATILIRFDKLSKH
ncbi:MAG: S-layer homology domain-containing protein [Firmicutes bacterium]|nr:S-layer homology domain-containing protein [Bacillota bacterium]